MKKRMHILALILALCMLLSSIPVVSASKVQPRFTYLSDITTSITFDANGDAICKGKAITLSDYKVKIICRLQQYTSGTWVTLRKWSNEGNYLAYIQGNHGVEAGYVYRVNTVAMILDSDGSVLERVTLTDTRGYQ